MRKHLCRLLAAVLALSAFSGACGRKTEPLVPESPRPETVKGIKAETRGNTAWLSWPIPDKNAEGRSMNPADIAQFRIYRTEIGRDAKRGRFKLQAELDMTGASSPLVRSNIVTWSEGSLRYGQTYGYRIRAVSARGGVSRLSEEIFITPSPPLAVPGDVEAESGDNYTMIAWAPVTTWMDGRPAEGSVRYNIYRGTEHGRYDQTPLNKQPLTVTSYRDATAKNDHTYYYIIRSVAEPAPPWNESPDSATASATPLDRTPPSKPSGLTVLAGVNRVFLTWTENKEGDLAGYHVYRSPGSGKGFVRMNSKVLTRTTFSDDSVRSGSTYYYAVTAVDKYENESSRSTEMKAHVEILR